MLDEGASIAQNRVTPSKEFMHRSIRMLTAALASLSLIGVARAQRVALPADVRDVYIDSAGRAILETRTGDWRATAESVVKAQATTIAAAKVLLIDHQHRLWLRADEDRDGNVVRMFDGKTWTARNVSDIPVSPARNLAGIRFLNVAIEDAPGNVWLVDGEPSQGWWLHELKPTGEWSSRALHERAAALIKPPQNVGKVLKFAEPQVIIGPDGLFYAAWSSTRVDRGDGMGASGFAQYDGNHWSEYFYPPGSSNVDNVQSIIPLPDGSVGFVRTIDEPRVVWMSSAMSRPAPDLSGYIDRLASLSSRERETAQAELIAMGPRLRKALEALADQTDDPEVKGRIPEILQEISKPPTKGVYGGRFTFASWRLLHLGRTGRVYLAVTDCFNKITGERFKEALVTVSPEGVWTAIDSPTAKYNKPISMLEVCEDFKGRRWDRIAGEGIFLRDPAFAETAATSNDSLGHLLGGDAGGRLYVQTQDGVVTFTNAKP